MLEARKTDKCLTVVERIRGILVLQEDTAVRTDRVDIYIPQKAAR